MNTRNMRIQKTGVVVSNKMDKTVTVQVSYRVPHPEYQKVVIRNKKYYAHCEGDEKIQVGSKVKIAETRPISKLKRWRVVEVLEVPTSIDMAV